MVTVLRYYRDAIETLTLKDLYQHLQQPQGIVWVDMENPTEAEEETVLVSMFGIHPLAIEDTQRERKNSSHLPKVEEFGEYLFVVFNPLDHQQLESAPASRRLFDIHTTQLSAFISKQWLITHHYKPLPPIETAKQLCVKNPHMPKRGPDYLFHLIIDGVVDSYNPVLDKLDTIIDELEDEVFKSPTQRSMARILGLKKTIMTIRRVAVYQREMLYRLSRGEFSLITKEEMVYYRNVYDHLVRISDLTESYRDMVAGLLEAYLSVTSNRLNQIMKVLTIISTIFLPLSFITGFFGMNFRELPLSEWDFGVEIATLFMVVVGVGMLWIFRRNKWL